MELFGGTTANLEHGLAFASAKQKAIANNIANVDTPGYKAQRVSFREVLNETSKTLDGYRTNERHIAFTSSASPPFISSDSFRYRQNGNGVDMDKEQADLAENQIYYNALVDRLSSKYSTLQNVIKGGR